MTEQQLFFTLEGHYARLYRVVEVKEVDGVPSVWAIEILDSGADGDATVVPKERMLPTPGALHRKFSEASDSTCEAIERMFSVVGLYYSLLGTTPEEANQHRASILHREIIGEYDSNIDLSKYTVLELFALSYEVLRDQFASWLMFVHPGLDSGHCPDSHDWREMIDLNVLIGKIADELEQKIGQTAYGIGRELIREHAGDYLRWAECVFSLYIAGRLDLLHDVLGFFDGQDEGIKELMDSNWRPQYEYLPHIFDFAEEYNREYAEKFAETHPPDDSVIADEDFIRGLEDL